MSYLTERGERGPDELAWRSRAECLDADPGWFFPETTEDPVIAKAVCRRCPVRERCLDHALAAGEWDGVWGGLSATQRKKLRRRDRAQA